MSNQYSHFNGAGEGTPQRGGGFFASGGEEGSQSTPFEQRSTSNQSVRPVTLKQVAEVTQQHPDAPFRIDGQDVGNITFVATLRNRAEQSTHLAFLVEDGTGSADVRMWQDQPDDAMDNQVMEIPLGSYVRVYGMIRAFNKKRHVLAVRLVPIKDHNELTMHLLEVIHTHLYFTRGTVGSGTAHGASSQGANPFAPTSHPNVYGGDTIMAGGGGGASNMTPLQSSVIQFVGTRSDETGPSITEIVAAVGQSYEAVKESIAFLVEEGHLYSTVDDDHFRAII